MNFDIPTPAAEKEPAWLSLKQIIEKMSSFIPMEKCGDPVIKEREDRVIELVEYQVNHDDGTSSEFAYRLKGPRSQNTTIDIAHFQGKPEDGDWLGGGGTLSNYDEISGTWTDVEGVK